MRLTAAPGAGGLMKGVRRMRLLVNELRGRRRKQIGNRDQ
jgi:hypothetical protein